ncbi:DUF1837 domain-containing protein [Sinorhizobium meliloti]|uniref:HamA C-terminal domain-containing protein n=1 Tax=Rhizobium meliloti TaxID=382 RepID=UPI000FE1232F|nr:DUF1837 domain-containing protein [Sinorhizobium meliloti]RVG88445.1 DUF1837 domain-containing protein [Sinorhizobium meliloti]RVH60008.1 DUF1837 domain-containing protein [Sinorhizobium meliloti]
MNANSPPVSSNSPEVHAQELALAVTALLKDHSAIGIRLKEVPFNWKTDHHRLSGSFYYLTFADGVPTVKEFATYLYECIIPYCLPKSKIQAALKDFDPMKDYGPFVRLHDEAKNLFIRAKNQLTSGGEVGELILYVLLEWGLKAPRLVSKMYLKTNNNMPVHGSDGIHLGYDPANDKLTIYFGESKLYQSFSSAADAAFSSIGEFINNSGQISREIAILNTMSDIDTMSPEFQARILDYIDPYSTSASSLNKRVVHACLLGFEYDFYKRLLKGDPSKAMGVFEERYKKRVASACRVVERHYGKQLPPTENLHLFLLPFPSLPEFRKGFYEKLGITP